MNASINNSDFYNYQYDYIVLIGRFQPLHIGHEMVIKKALTLAARVIVLIGSSNQPRTIKNPFTFHERAEMIKNTFLDETTRGLDGRVPRLMCVPLRDQTYNDQKWTADVQRVVEDTIMLSGFSDYPKTVAIIGHMKDTSSQYLEFFPQWPVIEHEMNEIVSATDIRQLYFERSIKFIEGVMPKPAYQFMEKFQKTSEYTGLVEEWEFIKKYKKQWEAAPYPVTMVTVDAIVVQSGHILLIRRKASPGLGLLATPGGFLNQHEKLEDGMLRELKEETKLKVPLAVLRGSIKFSKVFDDPNRSLRGRVLTNAFLIELPAGPLPPVKGGDDAAKAMWIPINDIKEEEMFEDHWFILQDMIGRL